MNVTTIEISKSEALEKLDDYRFLNKKQKTREDERLRVLYKAVSKGARVVNIAEAFKETGLNELGQPKLAIARADWRVVHFFPKRSIVVRENNFWAQSNLQGAGSFSDTDRFIPNAYSKTYSLPAHTFSEKLVVKNLRSRVPHIPPRLRPTIHLRNFHILFEVDSWEEYPIDPFLLRRIEGHLFVVVAEWELTKLEASLLSSMNGN